MGTDLVLILLDQNFEQIAALRAFSSLQWIDRYYSNTDGEFQLEVIRENVKDKNGNLVKQGVGSRYDDISEKLRQASYIYRKDKGNVGVINWRKSEVASNRLSLRGNFLESLLKLCAVSRTQDFSGVAETVCHEIVAANAALPGKILERLTLGEDLLRGGDVVMQATLRSVYDVLNDIVLPREMTFRIRYDIRGDKMIFEVCQGLDRTLEQFENEPCVFSAKKFNVINEVYTEDINSRNYAYVAGQGEGDARVFVEVDMTNGGTRRELAVDASDLRKEEGMTADDYKALLMERGQKKLAEWNIGDSVEFNINTKNAPLFGLGDRITYISDRYGIKAEGRVTEIWETIDGQGLTKSVIIGKNTLTITQKIKRDGK